MKKILSWNEIYFKSMCYEYFYRYKLWLLDDLAEYSKSLKCNNRALSCKFLMIKLKAITDKGAAIRDHTFEEYWATSPLKQWCNSKVGKV